MRPSRSGRCAGARGPRTEIGLIAGVVVLSFLYKILVVEVQDMESVPVGPLPFLSSLPAYADHFALGMGLAVLSVAIQASEREPRFVGVIDRIRGCRGSWPPPRS